MWLDFSKITNRVGQTSDEGGIDVTVPAGTPITALADGKLVGRGPCTFAGGGSCGGNVVTEQTNVPGLGLSDLYYQHIRLAPGLSNCMRGICGGQVVHKGDIIGYSTGLVEVGLNPGPHCWAGVWGSCPHPGKWVDPEKYLKLLIGDTSNVTSDTSSSNNNTGSTPTIDTSAWLSQIRGEGIKIGLFIVAIVLTLFGFYLLFTKQFNEAGKKLVKTAAKAAIL